MYASELRNLSDEKILKRLEDLKEELFKLRFQKAIGQLENHSRLGNVKRDIARCKTVLHERQLALELIKEEEDAE
jgi:large subunit ribosomal protein L29